MKTKHYVDNWILNPPHELSVIVIGCGGTGSQVLTSLGRMNYALRQLGHPGFHVTAYDADIVTEANCGRQLFSEMEIGRNKAECLVTKLNNYFGTRWECEQKMYGVNSPTANIVISCVDSVQARRDIGKRLRASGNYYENRVLYWMDFGNTQNTGQVVIGTAGRKIKQPARKQGCVDTLPSVDDIFDLSKVKDEDSGPSCSLAAALAKQDLFINSSLTQAGMALMWKMFTKGILDMHGAFVNLETMNVNPLKVRLAEKATKVKKL